MNFPPTKNLTDRLIKNDEKKNLLFSSSEIRCRNIRNIWNQSTKTETKSSEQKPAWWDSNSTPINGLKAESVLSIYVENDDALALISSLSLSLPLPSFPFHYHILLSFSIPPIEYLRCGKFSSANLSSEPLESKKKKKKIFFTPGFSWIASNLGFKFIFI